MSLSVGFRKQWGSRIVGAFLALMACVIALLFFAHIGYYMDASTGVRAALIGMVAAMLLASLYACAVIATSRRLVEVARGVVTVDWKPLPVRKEQVHVADIAELSVHTYQLRRQSPPGTPAGTWTAHDIRARTRAGKHIDLVKRIRARDLRLLVPLLEKTLAQWGSPPVIQP